MSTYNEPVSYVHQSIDSILNQTYQNFELLIAVDNPLNEPVVHYLQCKRQEDKRISVIINSHNIGLSACQDKLISKSNADYIAHMDADDIAMPKRLEKELKLLQKKHLDLVGANVVDINENGNPLGTGTDYPSEDKNIKKYLYYGDCLPSSTWLFRKTIFDELRGYVNFPVCEDYDFVLRGALRGFHYGLIREPLVYYRYNPQGASKRKAQLLNLTTYYIQQRYRNKQTLKLKEFHNFVQSKEGIRMNHDLISYHNLISENKSIQSLCRLFLKTIESKVVRDQLVYKISRKLVKKR